MKKKIFVALAQLLVLSATTSAFANCTNKYNAIIDEFEGKATEDTVLALSFASSDPEAAVTTGGSATSNMMAAQVYKDGLQLTEEARLGDGPNLRALAEDVNVTIKKPVSVQEVAAIINKSEHSGDLCPSDEKPMRPVDIRAMVINELSNKTTN